MESTYLCDFQEYDHAKRVVHSHDVTRLQIAKRLLLYMEKCVAHLLPLSSIVDKQIIHKILVACFCRLLSNLIQFVFVFVCVHVCVCVCVFVCVCV